MYAPATLKSDGPGPGKKDTPYGEKESRKSVYAIADHMFRFWYRFIPENSSVIGRGAADLAYRRIAPHLADFMGKYLKIFARNIYGSFYWMEPLR